jgi:hypothetical protein
MEMVGAGVGDEAQGNAQMAPQVGSATVNQLPAIGALAGGALGSVAPVGGNIAGAALGGAAGVQAKRLIQRQPTTNIPALTETAQGAAQGAAGEMGGQIIGKALEPLTTSAKAPSEEWPKINEAIGATKKSVILPKSATTIEDAVKMPARGLQQEGFDAKALSKMNPVQQQAAVAPKWNDAGRKVFQAIDDATQKGVRLNIQDPINEAVGNVYDPQFAKRAQDIVQRVQDTYGISNLKNVSPSEAYIVRKALGESSNFSSLGDPKSAAKISASVYRGISNTLHSTVDGLSGIDQHYSDLDSAMNAINNAAKNSSLKQPTSLLQKIGPSLLKRGAAGIGVGAGGTLTYELWKAVWGK